MRYCALIILTMFHFLMTAAGCLAAGRPIHERHPSPGRPGLPAAVELAAGDSLSAQGSSWAILAWLRDAEAVGLDRLSNPGPGPEGWRFSGSPEASIAGFRSESVHSPGANAPVQPYYLFACLIRPGSLSAEIEPNGSPETATLLPLNSAASGTAGESDEDCFAFAGLAGETIFAVMDPDPGSDGEIPRKRLQVMDLENKLLADDESRETIAWRIRLPHSGTFYIRVSAAEALGYRLLLIRETLLKQ